MQHNPLGRTGLTVPDMCLGTMTWGTQNTEAEGHAQMDIACDHGVTFFDTAELYATVPVSPATQGRTEEIIGTWLAARGSRDRVTLATKVSGKGIDHIRGGAPVTAASIALAVEGSLRRLQTDHIDLYQIHWPNRGHYHFRRQWEYDPSDQDPAAVKANILEVLQALQAQIDAGKIGAIGLSNETVWGTMQFLNIAEANGLPRVASVQNEYSLMYRTHDLDYAECSINEDVGLFCYTPLAAGLLTGKYADGAVPKGSRGSINKGLGGRLGDRSVDAANAYVALAREHGLDPAAMALAFCRSRPFMTSTIFGATTEAQLHVALSAKDLILTEEVMDGITKIHRQHPSPY